MKRNDDEELRSLLREWQAPPMSPCFEERVLTARKSWRRLLINGSIRVPVPVACCLILLLAAAEVWRWIKPAQTVTPRVVVKTERLEVPVVRERVITKVIYKNRPEQALTFRQLKPVGELRPRIIRGTHDQN